MNVFLNPSSTSVIQDKWPARLSPDGSVGPRYIFYLVKSIKIANNSATTEASVEIITYLESLEF